VILMINYRYALHIRCIDRISSIWVIRK
jgi:hypothetical protein